MAERRQEGLRDEGEVRAGAGADDDRGDHDHRLSLAEALLDLERLTERLRRACPWDREQTAQTIVPHTVEEAYEVADAALAGDDGKLLDELGDLLFQVYFLALLLSERGRGDLEAVARRVHEKLVRRHPHVFGEAEARTAGRVRANWERIKREEEGREGVFHDLPRSLPALLRARKAQRRAAAVGFEYPDVGGAVRDLEDELAELKAELDAGGEPERRRAELGDLLFACVNVARLLDADPELELRRATDRFVRRVEEAARLAGGDGADWASLPLADQDRYFDLAKERDAT
jgi:MazG family protein